MSYSSHTSHTCLYGYPGIETSVKIRKDVIPSPGNICLRTQISLMRLSYCGLKLGIIKDRLKGCYKSNELTNLIFSRLVLQFSMLAVSLLENGYPQSLSIFSWQFFMNIRTSLPYNDDVVKIIVTSRIT